jgi:hypothetical protein
MRTRKLPSHGTVVAYVALFVALGGVSAYAAGAIGPSDIQRDAVRSKHIKDGQVKPEDLAASALAGGGILMTRFTAPATGDVSTAYGPVSGWTGVAGVADPGGYAMVSPNRDLVATDMTAYFDFVNTGSARRLQLFVNEQPTPLECTANEARKRGTGITLQCTSADGLEAEVPAHSRLVWMTDRGNGQLDTDTTTIRASLVLEAP